MAFTIAEFNPLEHRKRLESIWKSELEAYTEYRFEWLYDKNPEGETRTIVATEEDNLEIIGCGSFFSKVASIQKAHFRIGILVDFIVKNEHKNIYGPAVKLQRKIKETFENTDLKFIFGFPTTQSKQVFKRLKYKEIGNTYTYVRPLKVSGKIEEKLNQPVLGKIISFCADQIWGTYDWVKSFTIPKKYTFEDIFSCDGRFDALFQKAELNYGILWKKTSDYLNWRYANHNYFSIRFFCSVDKDTREIKGYAAYHIDNGIVYVMDMLTADIDRELDILLLLFIREMRKKKAASISISHMGREDFAERIKKQHFFFRDNRRACLIFFPKDTLEDFRNFMLEEKNWHIFEGEMDL